MHPTADQVLEQLDELVATGRLTKEGAQRVRAAAQAGRLDEVAREIRREHVRARPDRTAKEGH
jgi:polyhydroxyalkanoate synthesis regulator phasin